MVTYRIEFPRWEEDIVSRKRTLLHLPKTSDVPEFHRGDRAIAVPIRSTASKSRELASTFDEGLANNLSRSAACMIEIGDVTTVHLIDSLTGAPGSPDWILLNLASGGGLDDYKTRWDSANPDVPWGKNPIVWRIAFRYIDGIEALSALAKLRERTP